MVGGDKTHSTLPRMALRAITARSLTNTFHAKLTWWKAANVRYCNHRFRHTVASPGPSAYESVLRRASPHATTTRSFSSVPVTVDTAAAASSAHQAPADACGGDGPARTRTARRSEGGRRKEASPNTSWNAHVRCRATQRCADVRPSIPISQGTPRLGRFGARPRHAYELS